MRWRKLGLPSVDMTPSPINLLVALMIGGSFGWGHCQLKTNISSTRINSRRQSFECHIAKSTASWPDMFLSHWFSIHYFRNQLEIGVLTSWKVNNGVFRRRAIAILSASVASWNSRIYSFRVVLNVNLVSRLKIGYECTDRDAFSGDPKVPDVSKDLRLVSIICPDSRFLISLRCTDLIRGVISVGLGTRSVNSFHPKVYSSSLLEGRQDGTVGKFQRSIDLGNESCSGSKFIGDNWTAYVGAITRTDCGIWFQRVDVPSGILEASFVINSPIFKSTVNSLASEVNLGLRNFAKRCCCNESPWCSRCVSFCKDGRVMWDRVVSKRMNEPNSNNKQTQKRQKHSGKKRASRICCERPWCQWLSNKGAERSEERLYRYLYGSSRHG